MSLQTRAIIAVAFLVGFFALALGAAAGLALLGVKLFTLLTYVRNGRLMLLIVLAALGCLGASGVIVWSLLPRFDRFEPPGPELARPDAPELFRLMDELAAAARQAPPAHVYLVPEVNAFVSQRGGVLGFGSRRIMGVGLPLLQLLDVTELRAVLAHELGHFHGGDTRVGPFIYQTYAAVARTVENLGRAADKAAEAEVNTIHIVMAIVQKPFDWFWAGFMRVTQAVRRGQERTADVLAVELVGSTPLVSGLKKVRGGSAAYHAYMSQELGPALSQGYLPPPARGFERFLTAPKSDERMAKIIEDSLGADVTETYDSHPSLAERVRAAETLARPTRGADPRRSVELLTDLEALERRLVPFLVDGPALKPLAWEEMPEKVLIPGWRRIVAGRGPQLAGYTAQEFPREPAAIRAIFRKTMDDYADEGVEDDDVRSWAVTTVGMCLGLGLIDHGWSVTSEVGEPIYLQRAGVSIDLFAELRAFYDGKTSREAWTARLRELGLEDLPLGRKASSVA